MKDILLKDNDLAFQDGDLLVGDGTLQHKRHLLTTSPGELRQWVPVGVGIERFVFAESSEGVLAAVKSQFELDGMTVYELSIEGGELLERSGYE